MKRLLAVIVVLVLFLGMQTAIAPNALAGVVGPYSVTFTPYPDAILTMKDKVDWHQNTNDSRDVSYWYHYVVDGSPQGAENGIGVWARCCGGNWTRVYYDADHYALNDIWYTVTVTPSVRPDLPHEWKIRLWFYDASYNAFFYRESPIVYN